MANSTRRRYDKKFKKEAVRLVVEEGLSAAEVERRLNLGAGIVNRWVRRFCLMGGQERLSEDELKKTKEEISRLKKELDQVRQERDTLMSCLKALSSRH
ncbi:MAG: transposase [Deltaproteobacteria bacterium]|nr:transposase [Deltaproteobacteria bacterium]